MEIVHGSLLPFSETPLKHRTGGISFKTLLTGHEHTPENFTLSIARQDEFYAPVHRHNFDQFRFALQGDISLGLNNALLKQGWLSYHPEGTYYGPQQDEPGSIKVVLLMQCGGASGQGYMTFETMVRANEELAAGGGRFEGGKYYAEDGSVRDGYQALWEHVNGRDLVYPLGRYRAPVIMIPDSFEWVPVRSSAGRGIWKRTLGVFSERELRAEQLKIDQGGSVEVGDETAINLFFVLVGTGHIGEEILIQESCVRLDPGAKAVVHGDSNEMILLRYILPLLSK